MIRVSLLLTLCALSCGYELPPRLNDLWERVSCIDGVMDSNEIGIWFWIPGGQHVGKTLIVLGGDNIGELVNLVRDGYMVWTRRDNCKDYRPKLHAQVCREYFGYFSYLADNDPRKPDPPSVAFIHGHENSWHQRFGWASLRAATNCALAKERFIPIVRMEWEVANNGYKNYRDYTASIKLPKYILKTSNSNKSYIAFWNRYFGNIRSISAHQLGGWCCGQFVVPRSVIHRNPHEFYAQLLPILKTGKGGFTGSFNGFFLEYVIHLFFGEPAQINPYTQSSCIDDDGNEDLVFLNHSKVKNFEYDLMAK